MSDLHSMADALRALDQRRDLPNLRNYPAHPAAPTDEELRERLRQERHDQPRERSWDEQAADDAGQPMTGPL